MDPRHAINGRMGYHGNRAVASFNLWEKVQLTVFFVQEIIISTIFIVATIKLMRLIPNKTKRRSNLIYQLLTINFLIIAMDVSLLALEFSELFYRADGAKGVFLYRQA